MLLMDIKEKLNIIKNRKEVIQEAFEYYRKAHPGWLTKKVLFEIKENSGYSRNTIYRILHQKRR